MAFSLITSVSAGSSGGGGFTSGSVNTTGADLLIYALSSYSSVARPGISDSKSNTWSGLTDYSFGSGAGRVTIFYATSPTVGSGHTFTVNNDGNTYASLAVLAFSGVAASPFDVENGGSASGATSTKATGSITPSVDNEVLIAATGFGSGMAGNPTIDLSFTVQENVAYSGSNHFGVSIAYLIETTAAAKNPTWTYTSGGGTADSPAVAIASFKAAAGGGGSVFNPYFYRHLAGAGGQL